jgi:hypothetical protein
VAASVVLTAVPAVAVLMSLASTASSWRFSPSGKVCVAKPVAAASAVSQVQDHRLAVEPDAVRRAVGGEAVEAAGGVAAVGGRREAVVRRAVAVGLADRAVLARRARRPAAVGGGLLAVLHLVGVADADALAGEAVIADVAPARWPPEAGLEGRAPPADGAALAAAAVDARLDAVHDVVRAARGDAGLALPAPVAVAVRRAHLAEGADDADGGALRAAAVHVRLQVLVELAVSGEPE